MPAAAAKCSVATGALCPMTMPAGTLKRVHVNTHIIRSNKKTNASEPVVTVQWRGKPYRFESVEIFGPSRVVYSPNKPLNCGATVWVETTAEIAGRQ